MGGDGEASATTLRYYRSTDTAISSGDTEVGTDAVAVLAASGSTDENIELTAPADPGTYYYGACVDPVSGEADAGNNCSGAVRVTVSDGQMETESFDLDPDNSQPGGLAFANDSLYVVDFDDDKVYAYRASGQRDSASDFDLDSDNGLARGITFANGRFYVVDIVDDKVYAYQSSGQRDSASDFDLDSDNYNPTGITFANDRFYVVNVHRSPSGDDKVYSYDASGQRDSASEFDLDSDNGDPTGITFANDRFYVVDGSDEKVYAYQSSGQRDSASDFDLDSDNGLARGITFANGGFYVVDGEDLQVYAYPDPDGSGGTTAYEVGETITDDADRQLNFRPSRRRCGIQPRPGRWWRSTSATADTSRRATTGTRARAPEAAGSRTAWSRRGGSWKRRSAVPPKGRTSSSRPLRQATSTPCREHPSR